MRKQLLLMSLLVLLAGCTSEPAKPTQAEKPTPKEPELVTGRVAFQKMYVAARGWARDAQPYRLESQPNDEANGQKGTSAIWRASFASNLQHGTKPYTWSGSNAPGAPSRGISPGIEDTYNPTNSSTQVFDIAFLKVDSERAFEEAQKHGGDKVLAKTPDTPVSYILDWSGNANELIWHVTYGTRDIAKLRVAVNASSGTFIRVEK